MDSWASPNRCFPVKERTKGERQNLNQPSVSNHGTRGEQALEEKRPVEAVKRLSGTEPKRAVRAETQRKILFALSKVKIMFLHMGLGFSRKTDSWQVFQRKKCKKKSN
jgi:hypothetical protein